MLEKSLSRHKLNKNITWHSHAIQKNARLNAYKQKACVIWLTGLSGSGKSTIANELEKILFEAGHKTYLLDGDNIRFNLNKDLGFDDKDRVENIRRIAEVAKLFVDAGIIVICAFISPFKDGRDFVRSIVEQDEFVEVYINTPLEVCEQRDTKGLYKKARLGEIKDFTGIDSAYEIPINPEVIVPTNISVKESVSLIVNYLKESNKLC